MTNNKIEGRAKKFNGTAIDYVSIFNWGDGKCIAQITPDASGNWQYTYSKGLQVGISYIANGCEPLTHGPYTFEYISAQISSGFLVLKLAGSGGYYYDAWDKTATSSALWAQNFSQTIDIALLDSVFSGSTAVVAYSSKIMGFFDFSWVLEIRGFSSSRPADNHLLTLELLDKQDNVVAAIKSGTDQPSSSGLWYGKDLDSLIKTGKSGSNVSTRGELSFSGSVITYTNKSSSDFNNSFSFPIDISSVVKIRVGGSAESTALVGSFSVGYLKILP